MAAQVLHQICSWNVNGIRAILQKGNLQHFISKENPGILCLNECRISEAHIKKLKIMDEFAKTYPYQYWNTTKPPVRSGYSGVAIFSKEKPLRILYDMGILKHDQEGRIITAEYPAFILVACYTPNSGSALKRLGYRTEEWEPDFRNYLKSLENTMKKPIIVSGDLNCAHHEIDIARPDIHTRSAGFTSEERAEFDKLLAAQFIDTFRFLYPSKVKYTYWSARGGNRFKNSGWRLDYFLLSEGYKQALVDSEILDQYYGSDHCPIRIKLNFDRV